ncbi:DoxX family protein [Nonomuraea sp. NPDC004297]
MILIVLLVATAVFRLLGLLGVRRFGTWRVSAAHGLAVMLVMTASAHFVPGSVTFMPNYDDMVAMVPSFVPAPGSMVYLTGVLELAGAAGLVLERTRGAAGICLALLFVVLLPANVYAATAELENVGSPLWQRIPEQILYISIALWGAGVLRRVRGRGGRQVAGVR